MRSSVSDSPGHAVSELLSLDDPAAGDPMVAGAKAAALATARAAGLPALPGFVVPVTAASEPMRIGRAALAKRGVARRAVMAAGRELVDATLLVPLRTAVDSLGGRVIVRSSSPLESDLRWAGAFSTVNEIGPEDIAAAVSSCWASAFAPDPLERLEQCGWGLDDMRLAVLLQRELRPHCGGTAHLVGDEVRITGVRGHPGPLLAGWAGGVTVRVNGHASGEAAEYFGTKTVADVADLARAVHQCLGDDVIEWASDGAIHLLQSSRSVPRRAAAGAAPGSEFAASHRIAATACVPGEATGRLVYARPHQPIGMDGPVILVCERPLPAFAPLVFGVNAVVSVTGGLDAHLAEVARSLGVPMLVQTPLPSVIGPLETINTGAGWLGAVDGARGELALRRAEQPCAR